jgi:hypothetical protein
MKMDKSLDLCYVQNDQQMDIPGHVQKPASGPGYVYLRKEHDE